MAIIRAKTDIILLVDMENIDSLKRKPNRLLQGLIFISLAVHFVLFLHISGIYRSKTLTYIELTMQDMSESLTRTIPRPVSRSKTPDQPREVKRVEVKQRMQPVKPVKIDPIQGDFSEGLMEGISVPEIDSGMAGVEDTYRISDFVGNDVEFGTSQDYLEMVILKIESVKEYPEQAKVMKKEGSVTVGFVVTLQGMVKDVRIIKSCRHDILNNAALKAVNDASPFPKPPLRFFNKEIPLQLNIIFETT